MIKYTKNLDEDMATSTLHMQLTCKNTGMQVSGKTGRIQCDEELLEAKLVSELEELIKADNEMDFGDAIRQLKDGCRVARAGWNGKGMWLELQVPDEHSKMTQAYIYMKTADNQLVPWLASQTDILAEDWRVY